MNAPATITPEPAQPTTQPCEDCQGTGTIARHVCASDEECRRKCLRVEVCFGCLGRGTKG